METPEQAAHAQNREAKSAEHEAADLQAQRDAADGAQRAAASAERQEVPAIVQIWLASIGTVIAVIALVSSILTARRGDRTARAQTRAYVGVSAPKPEGVVPKEISLVVRNGGQTPAYGVHGRLNMQWYEGVSDLPPDFSYPDYGAPEEARGSVATLNPGGETTLRFEIADPTFFPRLRHNEISLFIYGRAVYRDAFGTAQRTNFSYQCFPAQDAGGMQGWAVKMLPRHNDAT